MNCHSRTYSKTPHLVSTTVSAVDLSLLPFLVFSFFFFIHETQLLPHSITVKPPFRATSISYSGGVLDTWPNIRGRHQVCVYSLFTFCRSASLLLSVQVNPSPTCYSRAGTWAVPARPGPLRALCRVESRFLDMIGTWCRAMLARQVYY